MSTTPIKRGYRGINVSIQLNQLIKTREFTRNVQAIILREKHAIVIKI